MPQPLTFARLHNGEALESHYKKHLIVVYHANCIDGLASAWAFDLKHGLDDNIHISYIPYGHHNIPDAECNIRAELSEGAEVYFADVAPTKDFLDELLGPSKPRPSLVRIIDHHKSAFELLKDYKAPAGAPEFHLFIDPVAPAASAIVWGTLMPEAEPPVFLSMIEKMDLSRDLKDEADLEAAALIDSKSIATVGEAFNSFWMLSSLALKDMRTSGRNILSDQKNRINKLTDNIMYTRIATRDMTLGDAGVIWVPTINADVQNFGRQISDYLREQGEKTGFGMAFAWYVQSNGSVTMSIRSDGEPDARIIAQYLCAHQGVKGGGHRTSAAVHFSSLHQFANIIPLFTEEQMMAAKTEALAS